MSNSKNDLAWEKLFEKYKIPDRILNDGHFEITATTINEFREARLMTKFDHQSQLPELFAKHKLSILPTSRGSYVMGEFETFCKFNTDDIAVSPIEFPTFLESLDYRDITSEATAINCAFVSKILHDFIHEDSLLPTVSGRMSSSAFSFGINAPNGLFTVNVENSQVEIDGGYESDNSLTLIEAKNYISDDFLVRQLYYPFKLWRSKIKKPVRSVFLTYTNGVFHLREYAFPDVNHYNSVVLLKHKKYVVQEGSFNLEALVQIIDTTKGVEEPAIPFPQADSFERVINLCELLKEKEFIPKEDITQNYDFDARQTDYYANAGKYLGLTDTGKDPLTGLTGCFLTPKGNQVFSLNLVDRQKEFARLILAHTAFKETVKLHLDNGEMPDKAIIVEVMKRSELHNVDADTTYFRRASTIIGWTNWIISQMEA
jgi:hypothetical protein